MAKTSGSLRVKKTGGFSPGDSNYKGSIKNIKPLSSIKHNDVYREIKQGISRYHAELGVRERNVKLAELSPNVNGVQMSTLTGENKGIYLNSRVYNMTKGEIIKRTRNAYNSGWSTITNKPIQHTITHELAHATWNTYKTGKKYKTAGKEISSMYSSWLKDKSKKGYGTYAKTNVNEFFAEVTSKAVHGKADSYTRKTKRIIKKYKL